MTHRVIFRAKAGNFIIAEISIDPNAPKTEAITYDIKSLSAPISHDLLSDFLIFMQQYSDFYKKYGSMKTVAVLEKEYDDPGGITISPDIKEDRKLDTP